MSEMIGFCHRVKHSAHFNDVLISRRHLGNYYYNNDHHRQLLFIDLIVDVRAQFTTIMPNMQVFVYIVVQREREAVQCTSNERR